jgi:hypothetical protein
MFIPAYASISSIQIDNKTTTLEAIRILLDKYHITNSPNEYSLYKVYQSGEIRELSPDDIPIIERLWMGPFNEDKIFIMERGRQLNETNNFKFLPQKLLIDLVDNLKQEESKEKAAIINKYTKYCDHLQKFYLNH